MAQAQPVALQVRVPLDQSLTSRLQSAHWRIFVTLSVLAMIDLIVRAFLPVAMPASADAFNSSIQLLVLCSFFWAFAVWRPSADLIGGCTSIAAVLRAAQQEQFFYRNARGTVPDVIPLGMSADLRTSV